MTDVADATLALIAEGKKPTGKEIAKRIGVSHSRVNQIQHSIERWHARPHIRQKARYLLEVLNQIEKAAK